MTHAEQLAAYVGDYVSSVFEASGSILKKMRPIAFFLLWGN